MENKEIIISEESENAKNFEQCNSKQKKSKITILQQK